MSTDGSPAPKNPNASSFVGRPLDRSDVSHLYETYSAKLIDVLVAQLGLHRSPEVVEDAVGDVFTELFARVEGPRPLIIRKDPFQFLVRCVRNRIADRAPKDLRGRGNSDAMAAADGTVRDRGQRQPLSVIVGAEVLEITQKALESLSEEERRAFELVRHEGLSTQEAATRLGISGVALRRALGRAERNIDHYRARYWSTFVRPADSFTYKPRGRKATIGAFLTFPKDSRDVLMERYAHRAPDREAAFKLGLSLETYRERLAHAEQLIAKRFGMKVPDELEKLMDPDTDATT